MFGTLLASYLSPKVTFTLSNNLIEHESIENIIKVMKRIISFSKIESLYIIELDNPNSVFVDSIK